MATDNITDKNTLKSWFKRGLKPLEVQFHAWMDSYWHKSESIPTSSIENLETTLNSKAESSSVEVITKEIGEITKGIEDHINDTGKHKTEKEQSKLDNLADNPDATYASKDELRETKEFNTLYLNTSEIDLVTIRDGVLDEDLLQQFSQFDNLEKPFNLVFNDMSLYVCDNVKSKKTNSLLSITATIPEKLQGDVNANTITILYLESNNRINISFSSVKGNNIFLTENVDGMISSNDKGWSTFESKLNSGEQPVVYLKSKNSMGYCPVVYEFTKDNETNALKGFVEISYPKTVDGIKELWVEKWEFTNGIAYAIYQYSIDKFPLEMNESPVIILEGGKYGGEFTVTNPEVVENIVMANNEGKKPRVLFSWTPMLIEAESVMVSADTYCLLLFSYILTTEDTSMTNLTVIASKSNGVWSVTVKATELSLNDFMQVKNIYVVAEYPTDLTTYADGSIFIKQQAS